VVVRIRLRTTPDSLQRESASAVRGATVSSALTFPNVKALARVRT